MRLENLSSSKYDSYVATKYPTDPKDNVFEHLEEEARQRDIKMN